MGRRDRRKAKTERRAKRQRERSRKRDAPVRDTDSDRVTLSVVGNPFYGIPRDVVGAALEDYGRQCETQFDECVERLQERLVDLDPLNALASASFYCQTRAVGPQTDFTAEGRYSQAEIELLQSLFLRRDYGEYVGHPAFGPSMQDVLDLTKTSIQTFLSSRYQRLGRVDAETQLALLSEMTRAQTMTIRNWGYPDQMDRIVRDLLAPFDDDFQDRWGIRGTSLLTMIDALGQVWTTRTFDHIRSLAAVACAESPDQALRCAAELLDVSDSDRESIGRTIGLESRTVKEVTCVVMSFMDQRLPEYCTFSLDEFRDKYPGDVSRECLSICLDRLAISFGELRDCSVESLLLDSPIRTRPLVKLESGAFFIPLFGLCHSSSLAILESFVDEVPRLRERYSKRRSRYPEQSVDRLLREAFPDSVVHRGLKWTTDDGVHQYENDLLVLCGGYAVLAEAKSGRVSNAARRGGDRRLTTTMERLIVEPTMQAERFAALLRESTCTLECETSDGTVQIDTSAIYRTVRLNVTLDVLPTPTIAWGDLRDAGIVPPDLAPTPTIPLSDLEVAFEVLDGPAQKMHYLSRRMDFERDVRYLGDEGDLLSLYLESGFSIQGIEGADGAPLAVYGESARLHDYFLGRCVGEVREKPKLRLTDRWGRLVERIEESGHQHRYEVACRLLDIPYEQQLRVDRDVKHIQQNVRRHRHRHGCDSFVVVGGPPARRTAVAFFSYADIDFPEVRRRSQSLGGEAIATEDVSVAIVFALDVDVQSATYDGMYIFKR